MDVAYQDSIATIAVGQPTYATFWRRLAASLIDGTLIRVFSGIAASVIPMVAIGQLPIVDVLYSILFIAHAGTPGMRMLGMRVVDGEGEAPGLKRAVIRYLIPAVSVAPWYLFSIGPSSFLDVQIAVWIVLAACSIGLTFLDALWMIWDDQKQMLHDKLAKTWVIRV